MSRPCPKCFQVNPSEASFCLNCATPLPPQAPNIGGQQNQQWQQPPVGGQAYGGQQRNQGGTSQKAVASLILAICAFLCCGPFTGIPAAIVGWMELDAIKAGRSPAEGKWMAMVGLWGGIVSTFLHVGVYCLWVLMSMLGAAY